MTNQNQPAVTSSTTKPCCPRSIFWTNLVLLGFDPPKHAVGTYSAIAFDQDVFTGVNNVKAMEPIVWFLFNKLDPNKAKKRFSSCWPVTNLGQSKEFRNVAFKWLEQLRKDGCLGNNDLVMRRSFFDECQGERFDRIIMALSNYVVTVVMKRDYRRYSESIPQINLELRSESSYNLIKSQLISQISAQAQKFAQDTQERNACQARWKSAAEDLTRRLRETMKQSNDLQRDYYAFYQDKSALERIENLSTEQLVNMRSEQMESVRRFWTSCLTWMSENKPLTDNVDEIIHDRANKHRLDGKTIPLDIPEIMMTMWENQFQKERINPYQNGNLDLISLLKTYKLYLQTLSQCSTRNDTINSNQPPPSEDKGDEGAAVSDTITSLSKQILQEQRSQIKSLSSMKAALQLQLQDVNESIGKVRKEC
ncbi:3779_t:CDS:2, partial [Paraglomus brasilianum]